MQNADGGVESGLETVFRNMSHQVSYLLKGSKQVRLLTQDNLDVYLRAQNAESD